MEIYGVYQKYNRVKFSVLIYIKKKKKLRKKELNIRKIVGIFDIVREGTSVGVIQHRRADI